MGTFVLTIAIFKNGENNCRRSDVIVYLKPGSRKTYTHISQLLLCVPNLLRYVDIEFGSHFEKWPSPRYAQFLKFSSSRILKPYVYITQINSQIFLSTKCLRAYRAGPGQISDAVAVMSLQSCLSGTVLKSSGTERTSIPSPSCDVYGGVCPP